MKTQILRHLDRPFSGDRSTSPLTIGLAVLILLNVAAAVVETVPSFGQRYPAFFKGFEAVSCVIFTIEYVLRLWAAPILPGFEGTVRGRLRYAATPLAIIDLLAVLPFYLPMVTAVDLRTLRVFRLARILRILKLGRYSESIRLLGSVLKAKGHELLVALLGTVLLLVVAATVMFGIEHEAQPGVFSSVPATMWWGITTLSTVGYGDAYPVTPLGKAFGAIVALLGVGVFALPAGILASGFSEAIARRRLEQRCPHCGETFTTSG